MYEELTRRLWVGLVSTFVFLSTSVFAGEGTGRVIGVIPYASNEELFFVKVETISNAPACSTTLRFVLKSGSLYFKTTQAALLAAYVAGTEVRVVGTGACNAWSNAEDLAYVCFGTIPC